MAGNAEVEESSDRAVTFVPVKKPSPTNPNPSGTPPPPPPPVNPTEPSVKAPVTGRGPVSTGAPVQPAKPYLIEITLAHYPAGA